MAWLPDGEKSLRICLFVWQNTRTWQTDGQTDGETPHNSTGRAYI